MKRKMTKIAEDLGLEFEKVHQYAKIMLRDGEITGRGKNSWVNEAGTEVLLEHFDVPELVPDAIELKGLRVCDNPRWVLCAHADPKKPKVIFYVLSNKSDAPRLVGKCFTAEIIRSKDGITYRYIKPKFFHYA
jgi:hypothetical protein